MNVNLLRFLDLPKTEYYLEGLFSNGVFLVIVKPTRISVSSDTLIDHIYFNNVIATGYSGIIIIDIDVSHYLGTFYITH